MRAQHPDAGTVLVWGNNLFGQLGLGDRKARLSPQRVPDLPPAGRVTAGEYFSAILTSTWCAGVRGEVTQLTHTHPSAGGQLFVFGYNGYGQLGLGDKKHRLTPQAMPAPAAGGWKAVEAGEAFMVATTGG